ncbi:MAG TPA: maleylacetoacetate isomerase [Usitatibacter sp.]|nr:maleylacetoacetate isomerase [Usitatibacter sp.]
MILYDYFRSSAAYRVRIALNLKGLVAEHRSVHLRKGEQHADKYLGINPQGLVPTLVVGPTVLTQSLAIMEYLDEKHPLPPLLPEGAEDRAWVRSIAMTIACDIHPIDNTRVMQYLERTLHLDEAGRNTWYGHWIRLGFESIEKRLAERPATRYAFGDTPTLADICIVPQVANAGRVRLPMEPYPRIRAVNEACLAHPAFDAARPEKQRDAE